MLNKKLNFCLDHVSIATVHRDRPIDLCTQLGFVTADCYTDRTVHFIFDNAYFELCTYKDGGTATWLTQTITTDNLPRVHSYRLSNRGTDPNTMRNALIAAGIEEIGEINKPFWQHVRYGEKEGEGGYQTFFISNYEPFTDILFGVTTQLAKELIVKNDTKFKHLNGAKRIEYITAYEPTKERFEQCEAAVTKLYNAAKDVTDAGYNIDTYQIVDEEGYKDEFGCEPPVNNLKAQIVAIGISGIHFEFMKKRAYDANIVYFEKDGKLYLDTRRTLGMFIVCMK